MIESAFILLSVGIMGICAMWLIFLMAMIAKYRTVV